MAGLPFQAGDLAARDAAGDHLAKPGQVGADVDGEAVGGDPAPDADANCGQFPGAVHPRAGKPVHPVGPYPEAERGGDDRRLQGADVAAEVERIRQLDDGVGHQLARTMERDVPAAVDAHQLSAEGGHLLRRGQQVPFVSAPTDGVDRIVLEQEHAVADLAPPPPVGQLVLELPRGPIRDAAQPLDSQGASVAEQERAGAVYLPGAKTRQFVCGAVRVARREADVAERGHAAYRGSRQPTAAVPARNLLGGVIAGADQRPRLDVRIPSRARSGAGP